MQHTPYLIPQWKDPQPHFCRESLIEGRDLGPSIHQFCYLHPLYHNHSLLAEPSSCTKGSGLWYLDSASSVLVFTNVPSSPPGCMSQGEGWRHLLPPPDFHLKECSDTYELNVPNPHIKKFDTILVMPLTIISVVALTPGIILISITIPYTS